MGGGWGGVWTLASNAFCLPRAQNLPGGQVWGGGVGACAWAAEKPESPERRGQSEYWVAEGCWGEAGRFLQGRQGWHSVRGGGGRAP